MARNFWLGFAGLGFVAQNHAIDSDFLGGVTADIPRWQRVMIPCDPGPTAEAGEPRQSGTCGVVHSVARTHVVKTVT